ncbi:putative MFS family arabinose efflux permease [Hydrogenophaga palleronii]|uniref:MFS family arabinose efflux permease n=1 Tax=Hydrogenophaga palleronii TaxID=65655 RepID=A0ABU1WRY5_9BURK|nr:MFS transporter [Hydrogenophaga palleronii]MDR7151667.1 putative MFS family arabinose efflux permease [Hydrogenophaga palleronii]
MSLKYGLILMTVFAVISDALLIPFYPQFFSERYGLDSPFHVGAYVAAISIVVMCVFPLWVRVARRIETLHILQVTQGIAAALCLASYWAPGVASYWVLSLLMFAFKSSYLLNFPYLMRLETDDTRAATIGVLSVTAHLGVILGAVVGGSVIDGWGVRQCVLLMAGADLVQMAICTYLIRSRRMVHVLGQDAPERTAPRRFSFAGHAPILKLAVIMLLFDFGAAIVRPFFSVYWAQAAAFGGETVAGAAFAVPKMVAVAALLINRWLALSEHHPARRTLGNLLLGAVGLLLQAAPDTATLLIGRVLFGWALFQLVINFDIKLYALSTPDDFGRDYGVINIFQNTGVLIASFTAGSLVSVYGLQAPFIVACAGFVLAAALWLWSFPATPSRTPLPTQDTEKPDHAPVA